MMIRCKTEKSGFGVLKKCAVLAAIPWWMSFFSGLRADVSRDDFIAARPGRHSPSAAVSFAMLAADAPAMEQAVVALKESGFSALVLHEVFPGEESWGKLSALAEVCRKHSFKLECDFFPPTADTPLLHEIKCSFRVVNAAEAKPEVDFAPTGKALIARIWKPVSGSNTVAAARSLIAGRNPLPKEGVWNEYTFTAVPLQPPVVNGLDPSVFVPSVNAYLLRAQQSLGNNYGTVFSRLHFSGMTNPESAWSGNLPRWFYDNLSFDLVKALPVTADNGDRSPLARLTRERLTRGYRKLWREAFAATVRPLVHEAGLEAAVPVDALPFAPEEVGAYFQVPVLNGSTCTVRRARNRRACGGARLCECAETVGRVNPTEENAWQCVDDLLADGATRISFDFSGGEFAHVPGEGVVNDLIECLNRCCAVLMNSEPAAGFLCCSEDLPPVLNRFVFDSVNLRMLNQAEIANGHITFPSGRGSSTLVLGDVCPDDDQEMIERLRAAGVKVVPLADLANRPADFTWDSVDGEFDFRFVHRVGAGRDYFMIRSENDAEGMVTFTFRQKPAAKISRWQPRDGRIYEIANVSSTSPGTLSLTTPVRPRELFFVVFENQSCSQPQPN